MSSTAKAIASFGAGVLLAGFLLRSAQRRRSAESAPAPSKEPRPAPSSSLALEKPLFSLANKNAVVTGAASGIGFQIARLFAIQGAVVHVTDINFTAAKAAVDKINAEIGSQVAHPHHFNVADRDQVREAFAAIIAAHGPVTVLVNNAGIAGIGDVVAATEGDMDRLYNVNVKGVFNCTQVVVEGLLAAGLPGSIINLGSIASLIGLKDRFAYGMSKGAVLTMTYSVATDYVRKGIRCNAICPARVHTPFVDKYLKDHYPGEEATKFKELSEYQPIGRMGKPVEIAALAVYLASDESSFVTGSAYSIDGGVVTIT